METLLRPYRDLSLASALLAPPLRPRCNICLVSALLATLLRPRRDIFLAGALLATLLRPRRNICLVSALQATPLRSIRRQPALPIRRVLLCDFVSGVNISASRKPPSAFRFSLSFNLRLIEPHFRARMGVSGNSHPYRPSLQYIRFPLDEERRNPSYRRIAQQSHRR